MKRALALVWMLGTAVLTPVAGQGLPPMEPGAMSRLAAVLTPSVNVSSTHASPVTLRYRFTQPGDRPLTGTYCTALEGEVPPAGVSDFNPCRPDSVLGNAGIAAGFRPAQQASELLIVPQAIVRRAYEAVAGSGSNRFFFVRQFSSGRSAVVQLRLAGNTPNAPLTLTDVRLGFSGGDGGALGFYPQGSVLPRLSAQLRYRGSGQLRARWELVQPGDALPDELDLTPEAALSFEDRARQRRYRLIERVQTYLPPRGTVTIPGPDPRLLPSDQLGQFQILLRVEAVDSFSGPTGAAPFALPVLRYVIVPADSEAAPAKPLALLAPADRASISSTTPLTLEWTQAGDVALYRLEIESRNQLVHAARVLPQPGADAGRYAVPSFVLVQLAAAGGRWRLQGLDAQGDTAGQSPWRQMAPEKP